MPKNRELVKYIGELQEARSALHGVLIIDPEVDEKVLEKQLVCLQLSAACVLKEELEAEKKRLCE